MRRSVAIPILLLACFVGSSCRGKDPGDPFSQPTLIPRFPQGAPVLVCDPLPDPGGGVAVASITPAGDSALLVLSRAERRLLLLGAGLVPRLDLVLPEAGPGGVRDPSDAWLWADTLLVVADRGLQRLVLLDREGSEVSVLPSPVPPERLLPPGEEALVVVALVLGPTPSLLASIPHSPGTAASSTPRIPPVPLGDSRLTTLGNLLLPVPLPGGEVALLHRVLVPRGYRLGPGGVEVRSLPVPAAVGESVGRLPQPPFTEASLMGILTPALAAFPGSRGPLVLTRSGRLVDGRQEKALLVLDRELALVAGFTTRVNAGAVALDPGSGELLLVDDLDRWHRCGLGDSVPSNHGSGSSGWRW